MQGEDRGALRGRVTAALHDWEQGREGAGDELFELVYGELHRMAYRFLRGERAAHTLQTTALVHEAYLRLVDQRRVAWRGRNHFFAIAARLMRRILVDHARSRNRRKRLGDVELVPYEEAGDVDGAHPSEVLALNDALVSLTELDRRKAAIVELRYFGGFTVHQAAEILGLSERTVRRHWRLAKAWLYRELTEGASGGG